MPVIDVWAQHPSPAFLRDDMFASLRRWMKIEVVPDSVPLQFTTGAMRGAGIDKALLSAWWGPQGELLGNDEVAGHVAKQPDLLAGVASVDLSRPMDAVRELRRCVKQLGMVGVRVLPWLWGLPPNDRRY